MLANQIHCVIVAIADEVPQGENSGFQGRPEVNADLADRSPNAPTHSIEQEGTQGRSQDNSETTMA